MPPDPIAEILHSWPSTIIAYGGIIGAVTFFLWNIKQLISIFEELFERRTHMNTENKRSLLIFAFLLAIPMLLFTGRGLTQDLPPNVKMMKDVLDTFNEAKKAKDNDLYEEAIRKADELIGEFEAGAIAKQRRLIGDGVEIPKPGVYGKKREKERQHIWNFGPLHEVAAAWWVIGRSKMAQGKTQEAINAYRKTMRYSHALVFDPSWNGFWSPSQDAKDRMDHLNDHEE
uniref:Tetratricopeptide repeat-containing protein n=1 Tax=Candidatus Kentrum sp. MB TaxID=2138164 RepID=A0A450XC56_9GAMM|nr:MAG: hypothetical protein BECKMB1821G_GA0114241_102333 [Candidatus Kentron sp. MB]VFK29305.1 MAG: hypothetical protein BECKMB1821I_GA0114274_100921 [Candidatus Kentron sp. MB]VFK74736.1 MAG: hypothetical protein BECKMB1821H_GA0114242_100921 [Candidatus Kentron sp. MB]